MAREISFHISDVCQAFDERAVGTRLNLSKNKHEFLDILGNIVLPMDPAKEKVYGQHFVVLPKELYHFFSAGDGPKIKDPSAYHVRMWRGEPSMFMKREYAGEVKFLAAVVYTRSAYMLDPDFEKKPEEEQKRFERSLHNRVVVAIIASSGPAAPVTPNAFVHNIAGGNNRWPQPETFKADGSTDTARALLYNEACFEARKVKHYWNEWAVVSD